MHLYAPSWDGSFLDACVVVLMNLGKCKTRVAGHHLETDEVLLHQLLPLHSDLQLHSELHNCLCKAQHISAKAMQLVHFRLCDLSGVWAVGCFCTSCCRRLYHTPLPATCRGIYTPLVHGLEMQYTQVLH